MDLPVVRMVTIERIKNVRLWKKEIWNDIIITKWADLWPEDVQHMFDIIKKLSGSPATAQDYRDWLNGRKNYSIK